MSQAGHVVLMALAAFALALAIGIVVYAVGSFAIARGQGGRRPVVVSLRELAREMLLAALTQPLLPFFYFIGRRMDTLVGVRSVAPKLPERTSSVGMSSQVPVVFVHGYMQNRVDFLGLARGLRGRGFGPLYGFNYDWLGALDRSAERLGKFVDAVCAETGAREVDLVCHSMGGLVALDLFRQRAGVGALPVRVRRCVTIASPHAGVLWKGPILGIGGRSLRQGSAFFLTHAALPVGIPCVSIYSSHDNVVHPKQTSSLLARGGRDFEVQGPAHLAILFSIVVIEQVATFLHEEPVIASDTQIDAMR